MPLVAVAALILVVLRARWDFFEIVLRSRIDPATYHCT